MEKFTIQATKQEEIPILSVTGYFEKAAGEEVLRQAEKLFSRGDLFLVLNLSDCDVLSSPGVSLIVELAIDAMDNYDGKLIICGLDKLKEKVLTLVGIQTMTVIAATLAEAVDQAKQLKKSNYAAPTQSARRQIIVTSSVDEAPSI